ncbi:hypothetical protein GLOIN_2v1774410 [Rhizophagus irregularis DAOM 181602=DAOM 197198]|nr:hypothetical protein GLOIN_2v1774410 [Rhizophagus irregularis DAOM 181602=DAOM 197198]
MLIENSHGNIKNINIRNDHNFGYTKRLYKSIAINCSKIETDIEDEEDSCDEILYILETHKPFGSACLTKLLKWNPKGMEVLTVLQLRRVLLLTSQVLLLFVL